MSSMSPIVSLQPKKQKKKKKDSTNNNDKSASVNF